jgi:heme-degrading monooxygenase HmoA
MGEAKWASGQWLVQEGKESEFIELWTAWLTWTSENVPGFRSAKLLRSEDDPRRYVSMSDWDDEASRTKWKASPEFQEKFESVKALCDEFTGGDQEVVSSVAASAPGG